MSHYVYILNVVLFAKTWTDFLLFAQNVWSDFVIVVVDNEQTVTKVMKNFTEAINETTTALGQHISEEITTELGKSAKSMNDNVVSLIHLYGFIILIPIGIIFNSISVIIFRKSQAFTSSIGNHLKCISITDSILLIGIVLTSSDEYWEEKINFPDMLSLNNISCKISPYVAGMGIFFHWFNFVFSYN